MMGLSNYVAHYISFHTTLVNVVYANGLENLIQQQDHAPLRKRLFTGLVSAVTIRFLDLSGVVVLTKRSSGKPFKFLDISDEARRSSSDYIWRARELDQNRYRKNTCSKRRRSSSYTMNYLKEACEYKDTLDQVFQHYEKAETDETEPVPERNQREDDEEYKTSAFARQMIRVMELLDSNLEIKLALYRDPSLRSIFLMNNGRYILQKIKGSTEIRDLMGHAWTRKRSTELRQYHKRYQRETWGKVLQCMNQEGLQVNGKISKTALKERFKIFNKIFIPRKARVST
ncbi:unnamed protein product [Brassica oleracea var. botrytis]|uniref:Exocyst subunit Exo70 family protein n=2 Tax=Brassica oleracea TaxID=3712 RepID=A0A0D3DJT3_BRAOL|nr:unnamed protein product [Brassica oleracea]